MGWLPIIAINLSLGHVTHAPNRKSAGAGCRSFEAKDRFRASVSRPSSRPAPHLGHFTAAQGRRSLQTLPVPQRPRAHSAVYLPMVAPPSPLAAVRTHEAPPSVSQSVTRYELGS